MQSNNSDRLSSSHDELLMLERDSSKLDLDMEDSGLNEDYSEMSANT